MPAPPAVVSGMVAKQYAVPPMQYQVPKVMAMPQMAPVAVPPTAYGKAPQMAAAPILSPAAAAAPPAAAAAAAALLLVLLLQLPARS
eukprot:s335_g1.t1